MRRALLPVLAIGAFLLAGCDDGAPPTHSNPRDGRVTITWSDCAFGSCIYDWKVCVGPNLEVHMDGSPVQILANWPECKP